MHTKPITTWKTRPRPEWIAWAALLSALSCTKPLAEIETELGQTTTVPLRLEQGTQLTFPVSTSWVDYDDALYILLHVELLSNQNVVASMNCHGYSFSRTRTRGCGTGKTSSFDDCKVVVPPGGADHIRVSTKVDAGEASVRGLTVLVKEP